MFESRYEIPGDRYWNLGTVLRDHASGGTIEQICKNLMAQTAAGTPNIKVIVGLVDRGVFKLNQTPENFNNKLAHAETKDIIMSDHAMWGFICSS